MPTGQVYVALAKLISDLSERYSSPRFVPHVTLLGGLTGSYGEIESRASRLSAKLRPYMMNLTRIQYLYEYFRCLFIRVEETNEVVEANLGAREAFDREEDPKYMPHLSILYGNFPSATKDEIIVGIGRDFTSSFVVSSFDLVDTSSRPEDWFTIRSFHFGSTE